MISMHSNNALSTSQPDLPNRGDAAAARHRMIQGMSLVSNGMHKKQPPVAYAAGGLITIGDTIGPDIPCQVASPQSPTPFLRVSLEYQRPHVRYRQPLDTGAMPAKSRAEGPHIAESDELWLKHELLMPPCSPAGLPPGTLAMTCGTPGAFARYGRRSRESVWPLG